MTDLDRKATSVFEGQLPLVRKWAAGNARAFGLSRRETVGLAASFADLLKPMGFTAREATSMSTRVLDLSGALSKWSGGTRSAAEVSEILSSAMLGEREQLKELGISISEADVQARLAAKGQGELTGAAREQAEAVATMELVYAKSTDAQKAWADGGRAAAVEQNTLAATIAEVKEQLAAGLEPVLKRIVAWLGKTLVGALQSAKLWWAENKDAVKLLADTLSGFFTPAAKDAKGQTDGLRGSAMTLAGVLKALLEGILRLVQGWLILERMLAGNILMLGKFITGAGMAANVVDRLSGGTGHAADSMVAFGRQLQRTAREDLRGIERDARNAQRAIDAMHGKTLHFTSVWSTIGQAGRSMHQIVGQHGAVVRRPTMALIGEAGPEAVVPLHRSPGNGPLPSRMGGSGPFVLNIHIGGQEFGRVLVDPLRKEIRSLGGNVQVALGTG